MSNFTEKLTNADIADVAFFPDIYMISDSNSRFFKFHTALLWVIGVFLYALLFQAFYNMVDDKTIWPYRNLAEAFDFIVRNTLAIFVLFISGYLIIFKITNRNLSTATKILVDMVLAMLAMSCFNMFYALTLKIHYTDWAGTTFNTILTMLALETAYYIRNYQQSLSEKEEITIRMQEYRYKALKLQVNPHFLFNALNILYALVRTDSDKSLSFIEALSKIYRYVLNHQNLDMISLDAEMEFADNYMQILSLRYVGLIRVNYNMPPGSSGHNLIPFTMQILLENVVKHNVISKSEPMEIKISVANDYLIVSNAVRPKKDMPSGGTGLKYLTQLYEIRQRKFYVHHTSEKFTAFVPLI